MAYSLSFETTLPVSADEAWRWVTSVAGIAREMAPYLSMSVPPRVTDLGSLQVKPGEPLFRSWIKLFGVLPIDYSDLTLLELSPGGGFIEQSPMGSMKLWRHERRVTGDGRACTVRDELTFEPRFAGPLVRRIVRAFFTHRHRMLARHLGRRLTPA